MSQKENMLHAQLERKGDKLEFRDPIKKKLYSDLVANLEQGQVVDIFLDANVDDGTLAQLAKVHASIRELAKHTGYSFEDMKLEIKHAAGLCIKKEIHGESFMICKSFSKCSKTELGLAVTAIQEVGQTVGINFE